MGFLDRFKKKPQAQTQARERSAKVTKSAKDLATERGEPYVAILSLDVDAENLSAGSVELDWNDKFILQLQRHGYTGRTDSDLVDQWFTNVCRHIVMETYEQQQADPENRVTDQRFLRRRDMGDGRSEIS